eukprot:TRINITY_DN342_c0_g1_i4.p1 TRINITY_DN342_c0_g1~~TRINITY_DN342_c0_g1_i4.p1  ORF type:complete len:343 (+),score=133.64 TRINITY_DN342_c0_g1_i4:79-1107(+)
MAYQQNYSSQQSYPPQQGRGYPPQQGYPSHLNYVSQQNYPPQQQGRGYPPQQNYASQQNYPPQQQGRGYPPQQNYAQQQNYPPQQQGRGYPPQQNYAQQQNYPPQQQGRGFPPQQQNYPPQQQGGFPPQQANPQYQSMNNNNNYSSQSQYPQPNNNQGWGSQIYNQLSQSEIKELKMYFKAVDKDNSGKISARELSQMTFVDKKFGLATSKMLIKVFDVDNNGEIDFFEYCCLHRFIMGLISAFSEYDKDNSNYIDALEVRYALTQAGFQFSEATIDKIYNRFLKPGNQKNKGLDYETFIQMSAYLGQVKSTFELLDANRTGYININLEGLVNLTTSLPQVK